MKLLKAFLVCLVASCALSCRTFEKVIFENRENCPTWVVVRAEPAIAEEDGGEMVMHVWKDGSVFQTETASVGEVNEGYVFQLKKGTYAFSGLMGWPWARDFSGETLLAVEEGEGFPPLYAFSIGEELYDGEVEYITEGIRQLYFNVRVNVSGARSHYTFRCVGYASHDGYYYPSLRLHDGPYRYVFDEEDYFHRYGRFPRQGDVSSKGGEADGGFGLLFDYYEPESGTWMNMTGLDLAKYCAEYGYDWNARMLEDVIVNVRLADGGLVGLEIVIGSWHKVVIEASGGGGYVI